MHKKNYQTNYLKWLLALSMMLVFGVSNAQYTTVNGKVVDGNGSPLTGVNVVIKGTGIGTMTDMDGTYLLSDVDLDGTLIFSFVGFVSQEVPIDYATRVDVVLQEDIEALDEVVIIGYGSLEKNKITSAITNVKPEDFNRGNINNPAQLLQGKVPGLNIVVPQGNPNGAYNIRLRGLSTIGANTQPLIIIDGVIGSDLNSIDPNDIESIDILKDGGAAAIYGTRGSSGVIIIQTKTGKTNQSRIDYNSYLAIENMDRSLPIMTKEEYLENGGTDYGSHTDWMDEITRSAVSHVHNLSLSGGTEKLSYMASFNYRDIQGIVQNTGYDQLNGRLNLSQKAFGDRLTLNLNLALSSRKANVGFDDVFRSAIIMPPTAPVFGTGEEYDQYGGYFQNRAHELFNPMAIIDQNTNERSTQRSTYNIQADYKVTDKLTASARFAQNNEEVVNGKYISRYSLYGSGIDRQGLASKSTYDNKSDLFEMTGSYSNMFGDLNLNALIGYSYQELKSEHYFVEVGNFLTDEFSFNNLAAGRDLADGRAKSESSKESNKLIAFFGRINLSYDNTYFLTTSLRREGSSRFGEGNQWGNFVGLSAGADISRIVDIPFVDQLKLRGSYGVTGALPAQSYLSKQIYGPGSTLNYYLYNDRFTPVYSPQSNPNPDLKWETKTELDFGIDFSLLGSRLTGTLDYYNRKTSDALITLNVPVPPNLFPTTVLNAGKLQNRGFEVGLRFDAVMTKDFAWTPYVNFSNNSSKIISLSMGDIQYGVREVGGLPAPLTGNVVRVEEGKPLGQMIGWVYEGVDSEGNYILKDMDGNGVVNELDTDIIGHGLPKGEFSFGNDLRYKNFDLNFLFRGVYGHDLVNLHRTMFEQVSRISTYNLIKTKYFQPEYLGPVAYNSRYVEDASFIKLDNLSLGYNFDLPENSMLTKARVYVAGQNLFYITGYSGVDPEPRYSYDNNVLAPGIEPLNSWVTTRTYTLGVNFSF
ncbi:SusC/RagA family TonB-linked outer membrane protein [Flagellimonas sp.]|uniref:SusC/RagA family TonB-linked outer membrane protein n=1 Tax=Flagellimonas sp. TaxID=2058762 RepID=UPI003AB1D38E